MQLTAKLTQLLPIQTGIGKNGEWKKQDIIVETDGQYPKKVCISIWGDKINEGQLQIGNLFQIDFDIESREYNNKWYTDIKAWKIELVELVVTSTQKTTDNEVNTVDFIQNSKDEELPF
jgi:hypothetical protein